MFTCKKCEQQGIVVIRRNDYYCKDCFLNNINHKFRASIGKNKYFSRSENVLICLSGGLGSTVLLDLIHTALSLSNHKKLRISPFCLHVTGSKNGDNEIAEAVLQQCQFYKFDIHVCNISEYIQKVKSNHEVNKIPEVDVDQKIHFNRLILSMQRSARNDFMKKVIREIFISYAEDLQCNYIFTAETASTLAVNLISNISVGRGSQVQHDIGFCDNRNNIKILRPMKEVTHEELKYYAKIKEMTPVTESNVQDNSLQTMVLSFINDLQENFPATVSTICKTAEKLGNNNETKPTVKCIICESNIGEMMNELSALEATNYSRNLSTNFENSDADLETSVIKSQSMFPFVNQSFCYACSKNFTEMNKTELPDHIMDQL